MAQQSYVYIYSSFSSLKKQTCLLIDFNGKIDPWYVSETIKLSDLCLYTCIPFQSKHKCGQNYSYIFVEKAAAYAEIDQLTLQNVMGFGKGFFFLIDS